jgi:hypothetical protein
MDEEVAPAGDEQGRAVLDRDQALATVSAGARDYFAARRLRVQPFVDRHFSLRGTLSLHKAALGWDIAKAPLNLTLAGPQILMQLGAKAADAIGARRVGGVLRRSILLRTAVARDIEWLIHTELLEVPFAQEGRESRYDALSAAILARPELQAAFGAVLLEIGRHGEDPAFRERLAKALDHYGLSRTAAAEITTGLLNLGAGAVAMNKLTPGAATLGPALAGIMAHQTAVGAFPLGAWLGGAWYGFFPALPSAGLVAATTGGLMLASASFAAFAGVVSDPIQRALGLHRARLMRMVDGLERQFFDPAAAGFAVHDHYVARLLDVFDIIGAAARAVGV